MVELGQLEKTHQEFAKRQVRVVVVSNDEQATARETQQDVPHLTVIADHDENLARALHVLHAGAGPQGRNTNAPTVFLVDGAGKVRWLFRPDRFIERLTADEELKAIDENLPESQRK